MPFDHAAAEAQISANIEEIGDAWQIGALGFSGPMATKERPDGMGGIAFDLELTVNRSRLGTTLPAEGATVTNTRAGATYRLIDHRPGDTAAQIILVITSALH
jgi:hypothetical protein